MIKNINIFCISVSFKKASVDMREKFAFSNDEENKFLKILSATDDFFGAVILSTCNRMEIYVSYAHENSVVESLEKHLGDFKKISKNEIKEYCFYYQDEKAIRHLFKVCCGLDSMVLGEDEILHQTKEAYLRAKDGGYVDGLLNIIFQGAFNCSKLTKSGSKISNTPVSIGTLAANTVQDYLNEEDCSGEVLVIGATGKMGSIVAKDLLDKGINVTGTARSHTSEELFRRTDGIRWIDYHKRYEYMSSARVVVSATTSPHYTVTQERFVAAVENEGGCEKEIQYEDKDDSAMEKCMLQTKSVSKLLIDLAVPCDIDKSIGDIPGIKLLDIDYFNTLSKENGNIRISEIDKVKYIVNECVEELLKKLYMRRFQEILAGDSEEGAKSSEPWFSKMTYYLKDVLDSTQLCEVLDKIYEKEIGK